MAENDAARIAELTTLDIPAIVDGVERLASDNECHPDDPDSISRLAILGAALAELNGSLGGCSRSAFDHAAEMSQFSDFGMEEIYSLGMMRDACNAYCSSAVAEKYSNRVSGVAE